MILVAGLAVAGLVGIAAAFYFSIRSGNGGFKRNSRVRSGDPAGADRHPDGSRSRGASDEHPANGHRAANNSRAANPAPRAVNPASGNYRAEGRSGPNTVMDFGDAGDPGRASGPAPAPAGRRTRADSRPPEQVPTLAVPVLAAGNLDDTPGDAGPVDPAKMPRSRRRVGFRKGADIDEEMWPTESFGGVTDDQFWDDLASDKPLTTTARSAQRDSGSQKRPLAAVPPPGPRGQGDDRGGERRARNSGGYPDAQPGAADRTAVQPVQAATQPVPSLGQPASAALARTASYQAAPPQTGPAQSGPGQAGHLSPAGGPYQRTSPQSSPSRGWRHASGSGVGADEDPLTSAAFSLRASGPVDGNSQQAPRRSREVGWDHYDVGREHYDGGRSQETQTFGAAEPGGGGRAGPSGTAASPAYGPGPGSGQAYGGVAPYPYPGQPYRDPAQEASATARADAQPYGESYGYGNPAASGEDPRRPNGGRSHARRGGDGAGNRAPGRRTRRATATRRAAVIRAAPTTPGKTTGG